MKITICGSILFIKEMYKARDNLLHLGFNEVYVPIISGADKRALERNTTVEEDGQRKIQYDLIKKHYSKIKKSDAILVINKRKNDIEGYIGGNTFLEMGFAYVLDKPIFLINKIPKMPYTSEIIGMKPILIEDLGEIINLAKK